MFEDIYTTELTPAQEESIKTMEERQEASIQKEIERRMLDPEYIIDALSVCLKDNKDTGTRLADVILNHGDRNINLANVKMDLLDWITFKVRQDAERGILG